jgi:hypothetical protein
MRVPNSKLTNSGSPLGDCNLMLTTVLRGQAHPISMMRALVPEFTRGVLYLFDLGFFERQLFVDAAATRIRRVSSQLLLELVDASQRLLKLRERVFQRSFELLDSLVSPVTRHLNISAPPAARWKASRDHGVISITYAPEVTRTPGERVPWLPPFWRSLARATFALDVYTLVDTSQVRHFRR